MEPVKAKRTRIVLIAAAVIAAALPPMALVVLSSLHTAPSGAFLRKDLPTLALDVEFKDAGERAEAAKEKQKGAAAPKLPEGCPELVGGDTEAASQRLEAEKLPENCPRTARWVVKRAPIAFSLYFQDGAGVLAFFENQAKAGTFFNTRFFDGLFYEPLHAARIRAEDLGLQGLEGAVLWRLVTEALKADAELHYDVAHGNRGFVFSFVRDKCAFASKALPVICGKLARSAYTAGGLPEPVLEMRAGLLRLFLTEYKERIYLANGLEALLNVLESLKRPAELPPGTALAATLRTEAFIDRFLPVVTGEPVWDLSAGFAFSGDGAPGMLQFKAGKLTSQLRPKMFKGVLASIPHDAFAAVAASYHVPPGMTEADWQGLVTRGPGDRMSEGPEEGGFAIVWDLAAEDPAREQGADPKSGEGARKRKSREYPSEIGIAIANGATPDRAMEFKRYFADPNLTDECGGGTVFLAATSRPLLARMKESCAGQSLSVLDWERGAKRKDYEAAQLFAFMSPGAGMREIFLAGGAVTPNDFKPEWKQQYEQAKQAMREDGEKAFRDLPIFAYAGNAAPGAELVQMKGFTVRQGASR